jgi:hypothetical protein
MRPPPATGGLHVNWIKNYNKTLSRASSHVRREQNRMGGRINRNKDRLTAKVMD